MADQPEAIPGRNNPQLHYETTERSGSATSAVDPEQESVPHRGLRQNEENLNAETDQTLKKKKEHNIDVTPETTRLETSEADSQKRELFLILLKKI